MTEETNAVTEQETAPVTEVEATETESPAVEEKTEKVDDAETHMIPRARMNEAVQKERAKAEALAAKAEQMEAYEKLAQDNPAFAERFNQLIDDVNNNRLTQKEIKEETKQLEQEVKNDEFKDSRVDVLIERMEKENFAKYDNDFMRLAKQDYEDASDIAQIGRMVTDEILKANPNAKSSYDPGLIEKAYNNVKKQMDAMHKRQMAKYMDTKASDDIPATTPGAAPVVKVDIANASRQEVSNHLAERLRAGKN